MELQESKKSLAGVLLSPHDGGHTDDSLGTLQVGCQHSSHELTSTNTLIAFEGAALAQRCRWMVMLATNKSRRVGQRQKTVNHHDGAHD